ncbi:MAG: mitochondrial fission ELM1 family protein [Rhodospirillales bacterium]|nr:mitochondrial fission ELM1 family protein [Rhodospirillales bacterium]
MTSIVAFSPATAASPEIPADAPLVWLLMGHKAGDNAQVLALAEALDWPFEIKQFVYRRWEALPNLTLGATMAGIRVEGSSHLQPPWPALVISAGRRNEPIARWIRKRASAEGRRVRLVHLGRPWSPLHCFDLIVTTPQYRLPDRENILQNQAPLHRVTPRRLQESTTEWAPRFAHLPRPWITVLIGGGITPHVFDHETAARLAAGASALAGPSGGSVLVSTSPRTPAPTIDTLCAGLTVPSYIFRWSKEAAENPFYGMLAVADALIVTGDSMSMLAEACATGRPVHLFDLGTGAQSMRSTAAASAPSPVGPRNVAVRIETALLRLVKRLTPRRLSRDISAIHRHFVDAGAAVWLGDPFPARSSLPDFDGLASAVARVRALFAHRDFEGVD